MNSWLHRVKAQLSQKMKAAFTVKDSQEASYTLEWMVADIVSPELAAFKKGVSSLASSITASEETNFLKAYPEAVQEELFLKSCAPFFEGKNASVDWSAVEGQIRSSIQQFYEVDLSKFGQEIIKTLLDDIYFCMTLRRDGSNEIVGFLMAAITPALPDGYVKVINLVLHPSVQEKGLEKVLFDTLLDQVQGIQQLFLFVRPTNARAFEAYTSYGFQEAPDLVEDPHHKVNRRYLKPLLKIV